MSLQVMPQEEYRALAGLSSTTLKVFGSRSPYHAMEALKNPPTPTPAMALGTAVHARILEPETFKDLYVGAPQCDRRTKEGKALYAEFETAAAGKTVLSADDWELVHALADKVLSDPEIAGELSGGQAEGSAFWQDPKTGVLCKCRPDYYRPFDSVILDVKTTEDASPAAFSRVMANLKYHWSAAHYIRGISQVMNRPVTAFKLLVIEKKPPFAFALYDLHHSVIDKAMEDIDRILPRYAKCEQTNTWPGYEKNGTLLLPSWAFGDDL